MEIPPSTLLQTIVATRDDKAKDLLNACAEDIRELARLKDISIQQDAPRPKGSASAIFPRFEIFVPILGIVDISGELARIEKRLAKLEKEQIKISKKLRNESFLAKAPRDVVKKEEGKLRELITLKEKLTHNRSLLQDIGA
jgi:valyl-tRNA synthetase